jgi:replicative DNA helicase
MTEIPKKPTNLMEFGNEFQQQLIAEIITDRAFGLEIIEIIKPEYFRNQYFSFIIKLIADYYEKHEVIPNYIGVQIEIDANYGSIPEVHKMLSDTLKEIQNTAFNDLNVKEITLRFCKFQSVRNAINDVKKQLDNGVLNEYDVIEEQIRKAITFKDHEEGVDFFTNLEHALDDDYRDLIATGIAGLDKIMNGGLGKKEIAVIIAPLGVGKSTMLSIIGSNAYQSDKNVLHIFFEDKLDEIRRKYLTHWTGFPLEELNDNKASVMRAADEVKAKHPNANLVLQKLNADQVNIARLRRVIKHERNKLGGKLDLVIIDYADCIVGEQGRDMEEWKGEGRTMRQLEGMAEEFNVALWTGVQGGREATSAALVEVGMMGGNIKKAQVAHFIMSVAKTLQQRDQNLATIAILKSRFGKDGKVYENCTFNNSLMLIDTTSTGQTLEVFSETQASRKQARIREVAIATRKEYDSTMQAVEKTISKQPIKQNQLPLD